MTNPSIAAHAAAAVTRAEFEQVLDELAQNTRITTEVRDILATFNILFRVAKWTAAVAAAVVACISLFKTVKGL